MIYSFYITIITVVECNWLEGHVPGASKAMHDTQVKQDGEKSILYIGTRLTPINHETFSD